MSLSPASFDFIRRLLSEQAAIALGADKSYLVETRLLPVARKVGLRSIDELVARLKKAPDPALRQQVVDALTTNETSFFRDAVPFETLRKSILPELIDRRRDSRRINIWSAGCATGQEPYSVALILREDLGHLPDWKFYVLGTDVSADALEQAQRAKFSHRDVDRGVPKQLRDKYFRPVPTGWRLRDEICRMVEFRQFNLNGDWPSLPRMDIILARNVLVYFELDTRKQILRKFREVLYPDGCLLLGGAESAFHLDATFEVVRSGGFSYYRLS